MSNDTKLLEDALNFRRAIKAFDRTKTVPEDKLDFILKAIKLAPTSFGFEPYKVLVINRENKEKLSSAFWNQPSLTASSHLLMFVSLKLKDILPDSEHITYMLKEVIKMPEASIDWFKGVYAGFLDSHGIKDDRTAVDWTSKQAYIGFGFASVVAAQMGIDSCPLEGFDPKLLSEALEKDFNIDSKIYAPAVGLVLGYRKADNPLPRTRKPINETFLKFNT